jgi:hypothetical protein
MFPMLEHYKLPNGTATTSKRRYLSEWRKLNEAVGGALGGRVYGFAPGMAIVQLDGSGACTLPMWVVRKLANLIERNKQLEARLALDSSADFWRK